MVSTFKRSLVFLVGMVACSTIPLACGGGVESQSVTDEAKVSDVAAGDLVNEADCLPNCQYEWCGGDDGCGGKCLQCPEQAFCNEETWHCDCPGFWCSSNCCLPGQTCSGEKVCEGQGCLPNCDGKWCGDDNGCGDKCQRCPENSTCNFISLTWQCVCPGPWCGGNCCSTGQVCGPGETCQACEPQCTGKACGDDGCGGTCGSCSEGQVCYQSSCCTPQSCTGKECGDAGCGTSCGSCGVKEVCDANGQCQCVPQCQNKECGSDGCGGNCGSCSAGQTCLTATGICCTPGCAGKQCGADDCGTSCGSCPLDKTCVNGKCTCAPDCAGKNCGSDGCGGSCGTCPSGKECKGGKCQSCSSSCSSTLGSCSNVWDYKCVGDCIYWCKCYQGDCDITTWQLNKDCTTKGCDCTCKLVSGMGFCYSGSNPC